MNFIYLKPLSKLALSIKAKIHLEIGLKMSRRKSKVKLKAHKN